MTALLGLVLVAYVFKFAKYAEVNQGCLVSLFSVQCIYVAILFYFKFNEIVSGIKIFGMLLMPPCALLLSLDKKDAEDSEYNFTIEEMKLYGILAVVFALVAPIVWTFAGFYIRKARETNCFPIYDLAIDLQGYQFLA